jgi:hypothetical protein
MSNLFGTVQIKNMALRNRFVRSATVDNGAESGHVSEKQIKSFMEISDGGIGLIVTGMTAVHPSDYIKPSQNQLSDDDCIPAYKRLTSAVHNGGARIAIQLAHMGRERGKFLNDAADEAIGPSFIENDPYCEAKKYRAMTGKLSRPSAMRQSGPEKLGLMRSRFMVLTPSYLLSSSLHIQIVAMINGAVLLTIGYASIPRFTRPSGGTWARIILSS